MIFFLKIIDSFIIEIGLFAMVKLYLVELICIVQVIL